MYWLIFGIVALLSFIIMMFLEQTFLLSVLVSILGALLISSSFLSIKQQV
jgi:hypothetical protein